MEKASQRQYDRRKAQALLRELKEYEKEGTGLYLNGRKCYPAEIVHACVISEKEEPYMRDFIVDEKEQIQKINFIRIEE